MPRHFARLAAIGFTSLLLLSGCFSAQQRIDDNQQAFFSLPFEQQQLVKEGRIGIGFGAIATRLALGDPDRITEKTTTEGHSTIWRYVEYEDDAGISLYRGFYHYGYGPAIYPWYLDSGTRRERDALRVTFTEGLVTSIEEEVR